jgi:PEP-CTERM motif
LTKLSSSTVEKLSKTALLAGAALALPAAAHASVVFGTGSPINLKSTDSTDATAFLDVNADGTNDFEFTASFSNLRDSVLALDSNMWLGTTGSSPAAPAALTAPTEIGPDTTSPPYTFFGGSGVLQNTSFITNKMKGPWPAGGSAYLGLQFEAVDGTHYGWAQISACTFDANSTCDPASTISIIDWAWEDQVGVGIQSPAALPEPSSLALFALGGAGLAAFRLRRKKSN